MAESGLNFDRYHATMGNFALTHHAVIDGSPLADIDATFYVTQRKMPFAPCVGHERLIRSLFSEKLDIPRLRFIKQDKAGLSLLAEKMDLDQRSFKIRTVAPGTIMFAGEPIADIEGPFGLVQMMEVKFEHAFDEPMTIAGNALDMKLEAGERSCSDFSLRRDGSAERALEVAKYSFVGGFDDTSNMEAAFLLDINAVGTMAHYLVQAFQIFMKSVNPERDVNRKIKHFQQIAFERWLDAHPNGTTLLLDTISLKLGVIHAIRAAKSTDARRKALKAVRIDSGDLIKNSKWAQEMLQKNGLGDVKIILTADLDAGKIKDIVAECPFVFGFGIGTKLIAEVDRIAGVIFKLCSIAKKPTLKCSETKGKETIPGKVQIWRCLDEGLRYVKDVIAMHEENKPWGDDFKNAVPLLNQFYDSSGNISTPSINRQKDFVLEQLKRFKDIRNYRVEFSKHLQMTREGIINKINQDDMDEDGVVMVGYPS